MPKMGAPLLRLGPEEGGSRQRATDSPRLPEILGEGAGNPLVSKTTLFLDYPENQLAEFGVKLTPAGGWG